jgi:hypothetical protein
LATVARSEFEDRQTRFAKRSHHSDSTNMYGCK